MHKNNKGAGDPAPSLSQRKFLRALPGLLYDSAAWSATRLDLLGFQRLLHPVVGGLVVLTYTLPPYRTCPRARAAALGVQLLIETLR